MVFCLKRRAVLVLGVLAWLALPARGFAADKYLYVMGGGGDPGGAGTIFDSELKTFGGFASHSGWRTTLSFDGGHSKTEEIAARDFPGADNLGRFDPKHFQEMLQDITSRLDSGKIAPGDELMVMIDSHGAMNYSNQLTHDIATSGSASDLTTLQGTQTVSLDALRDVVQLANKKGVKLAIIDESCFSGNTLALANDKTCVISATGTRQFSYAAPQGLAGFFSGDTFTGKFNRSLKNGGNLEELFLNARTAGNDPDFPMISTPVGEQLRAELYRLVSPYLDVDGAADGYDQFSGQYSAATIDADSCETARNFSDLTRMLDDLSGVAGHSGEDPRVGGLKHALQKYRDFQIRFESAVKGTQIAGQEFKSLVASDYPDQKELFASEDGVTSLLANYGPSIALYQQLYDKTEPGAEKNLWKETLDQLQLKQKIVADLRPKLSAPAQESLRAYDEALADASRRTESLASNVSAQLKKVYDVLYRARSSAAAGSSNACRDFVL